MEDSDFIVDANDEYVDEKLHFAMIAADGSSAYRNDRERPYNGQKHTDSGLRGQTLVSGLTMRDIADCIVQGFLSASGDPYLQEKVFPLTKEDTNKGTWRYEDLYKIKADIDPRAVIQNALCFVEKYMGIFPNIEPLDFNKSIEEILNEL